MGWTWKQADTVGIYKNGRCSSKINVKQEVINELNFTNKDTGATYSVIKAAKVGRTVYAAVKFEKPNTKPYVFAAVFDTRTDLKNSLNFGFKDMDETCGPYLVDCPLYILDLLSPTEDEYAIKWRNACRERAKLNAAQNKLKRSLDKAKQYDCVTKLDLQYASINIPKGSHITIRFRKGWKKGKWVFDFKWATCVAHINTLDQFNPI